jgi:hypothetical protein
MYDVLNLIAQITFLSLILMFHVSMAAVSIYMPKAKQTCSPRGPKGFIYTACNFSKACFGTFRHLNFPSLCLVVDFMDIECGVYTPWLLESLRKSTGSAISPLTLHSFTPTTLSKHIQTDIHSLI